MVKRIAKWLPRLIAFQRLNLLVRCHFGHFTWFLWQQLISNVVLLFAVLCTRRNRLTERVTFHGRFPSLQKRGFRMTQFTFSIVSFFDFGTITLVSAAQFTIIVIRLAVVSTNWGNCVSKTITGNFTSLLTICAHTVVCLVNLCWGRVFTVVFEIQETVVCISLVVRTT